MWRWGPLALWALVIFVASSLPGTSYPQVDVPAADKMVHVAVFAVFGLLCARAVRTGGTRALWLGAALATGYGALDEIHQMFVPMRSPDLRDLVADALGGLLGAAVYVGFQRWRQKARKRPLPSPSAPE